MDERMKALLPAREENGHKGTFGTLLAVCGSEGMAGACILSVKAALRCGVGMVKAVLPHSIYPIAAVAVPEAMFLPTKTAKDAVAAALPTAKAVLCGCGLGVTNDTEETVKFLLDTLTVPLILDADGINAAVSHIPVRKGTAPLILTPHPGEMARLLGKTVSEVESDRVFAVTEAARRFRAVTLLKGHRTLIATPDGVIYENETGNAGMATAGSGDVLAGMIASFVAQGMTPENAAIAGVYFHGLAGDKAAEHLSQRALIASDLIEALPSLFLQTEK